MAIGRTHMKGCTSYTYDGHKRVSAAIKKAERLMEEAKLEGIDNAHLFYLGKIEGLKEAYRLQTGHAFVPVKRGKSS